ncbi:peptidoglycan-binding protein, partial [Streptomyces sp. PSRA5]|uniref:peptidoglycan-binding protein n=1 Tax=Streptomyces panacea TaxID=3035064 RepID=UPI00339BFB9A
PGGTSARPEYPGAEQFRPGRSSTHVARLGDRLVKRGFGSHYVSDPGSRWGEADRRNVEDFQRAQGWRGSAADGYPGPETWRRLFA